MTVGYRTIAPTDTDWASHVGYGVMLGLAWVLVAFSTARALQPGPSLPARLVSVAIPTIFAITLFVGGFGLFLHDLLDEAFRIAKWTVLGTAAVVTAVVANSIWFTYVDFAFDAALYTLVNAAISGAILGFLVGIYDAHRTQLEQDLTAESEHAAELAQRLSVINRVLRHDMRHQTQLIQGHADRLIQGNLDRETAAGRIQQANDRLLDLAEQTRKLQELLSGERFGTDRIDLVEYAERACETVQARHPELEIDCDLPAERPVRATPLIEDVIKELLDNAVIHNDANPPRATLSVSVDADAKRPVELTVLDNGPGLPETEPSRDGVSLESQLHHSNGFGLWFVTWVIEDTAGEIEISSLDRPEAGTEIALRFPTPS
ncbi:MAG: sensor histidine kinase [Halodesulfurarchaeum sp.]